MLRRKVLHLCLLSIAVHGRFVVAFTNRGWMTPGRTTRPCMVQESWSSSSDQLRQDAEQFLAKARALRAEIAEQEQTKNSSEAPISTTPSIVSLWAVVGNEPGVDYRLYVDIGREPGTWMDPRWGASGKRIEFTLDIRLLVDAQELKGPDGKLMNPLRSAPYARLRKGFDKMKCSDGGYRIEMVAGNMGILHFFIQVEGTEGDSSHGDISIPPGKLYFSLPALGGKLTHLSSRQGTVTVRQRGWNTGLPREESRIVGVFRAATMADAKRRDTF